MIVEPVRSSIASSGQLWVLNSLRTWSASSYEVHACDGSSRATRRSRDGERSKPTAREASESGCVEGGRQAGHLRQDRAATAMTQHERAQRASTRASKRIIYDVKRRPLTIRGKSFDDGGRLFGVDARVAVRLAEERAA